MHYVGPALWYKLISGRHPRLVFTFHTQPYVRDFLDVSGRAKRDYIGIERVVAKCLLHGCDEVTGVSDNLMANLNQYYHMGIRRYSVIKSGVKAAPVDTASVESFKARYELQKCYPILSSIGVFVWDWKVAGHRVCIEAVGMLRDKYPAVKLLIAGDGRYRDYLADVVRRLKVEENVRFLGNTNCVRELLASSDIYIHMAMHEGCPLSVVEAMYAARPVVAANLGGIPEIIVHGTSGLLIDPEAEELSRVVDWLMRNDGERQRLGHNAFTYASKTLSWDTIARQYLELYLRDGVGNASR
jgi:glycosyltransferase involved in cell wall biosynthesis